MACSTIPSLDLLPLFRALLHSCRACSLLSGSLPVLSISPLLALLLPALPLDDSQLHAGSHSPFLVLGEDLDPVWTQLLAFTLHLSAGHIICLLLPREKQSYLDYPQTLRRT